MAWSIAGFLKGSIAGRPAVPVADDNPLPVYISAAGGIGGGVTYETVAASQTDQVMGGAGAIGDFLGNLVITVTTAATAQVSIKDGGGSAIIVFPNSPAAGIGTYTIPINARSAAGPWKVTTGAGSTVLATGSFT